MSRTVLLLGLAVAFVLPAGWVGDAQAAKRKEPAGLQLARKHCAGCHAVGRSGTSPRAGAPLFRDLHKRYDLDNLQEAFVEGVAVGHRGADMPEFQFSPDATDALIGYLKSLRR